MKWWLTVLILCTYGMLKEFKPSEPYLYRYQQNYLNISGAVLNAEVYPYWTYSYLVFLVPVLLLADVLLYKPVLILESFSYIAVWLSLIFGKGVFSSRLTMDRSKYASVTVWTRAALQAGKCLAYFFSNWSLCLIGETC
uniref:Uncharacterized protein n=1 Tax=Ditylenchus dipsaci TaxID=166011 RepID=A0A915DPK0_9BILA